MNIFNKIFNFWRWHPEVAIRYLPVVASIKKEKSKTKNRILEIGSGWLGISPYLGEEIIGLDRDFEGKSFYLLKQIKGTVLNIPFKSRSFAFVICIDVLEHLPKNQRQQALREILRVTKDKVFLGVPCGSKSYQQDKKLALNYRKIFGQPFLFFDDHLKFGLPTKAEIIQGLKLAARKNQQQISWEIKGNENLKLREFLMNGWLTKNIFLNFIYRKLFLFLIPLFSLFEHPPYYRQLFFVKIKA